MWRPRLDIAVTRGGVGEDLGRRPHAAGSDWLVVVGEPFVVAVTVHLTAARRLRGARVALEERETRLPTSTSSGGNLTKRTRVLAETMVPLPPRGRAGGSEKHGPGELRFEVTLVAPEDAAPDYEGYLVSFDHGVVVSLDVAFALDGREEARVRLGRPACPPVPLTPVVRLAPAPKSKQARFLEVGLVTNAAAPGQAFRGACALSTWTAGGHLEVSLVGHEGTAEAHRHTEFVAVPKLALGEPFRFALRVPRTAAPSFQTPSLSLSWRLEVAFEGDGQKTVAPPLPVLVTAEEAVTSTESPSIGRARWDEVFVASAREAGEQLGFSAENEALQGQRGPVLFRITAGGSDAGSIAHAALEMVVTLRWPSLHLGLALERKAGFLSSRASTKARFRSHAKVIEGDAALGSMLQRFAAYTLDDHGGTLILAESPLVPGRLVEAVKHVRGLVDVLCDRVRGLEADEEFGGYSRLLAEFAPGVDGQYVAGALVITGAHLDGEPFAIVPWWGANKVGPVLCGLEVIVPCGLDGQAQDRRNAERLAEVLVRRPAPRLVEQIELRPSSDLHARAGNELVAWWRWDDREPMREVIPVVRYLHGVAEELGGVMRAGPYR
jgi:hypothetical protein